MTHGWGKKENKLHAQKSGYNGQIYDSKREAEHAKLLDGLRRATNPEDRVFSVERQAKFDLLPGASRLNRITHKVDFRVTFADGRVELHEVKGMITRDYELRVKLLRHFYPDLIYKIIK